MATLYELIDENENEYAFTAYNRVTDMLQLSFGNISLELTHKEFLKIKNHIQETLEGNKDCKNPYSRNIIIDTSVANMVFIFCLYEVIYVYEVITNTSGMLRI